MFFVVFFGGGWSWLKARIHEEHPCASLPDLWKNKTQHVFVDLKSSLGSGSRDSRRAK